jgi:ATP-GRASP peptide maturase of grasp-with-spasm system
VTPTILILSQSAMEPTTEEVMDWLEVLGARPVRLNGDDLDGRAAVRFVVEEGRVAWSVEADGACLPLSEVGAVWYRRWMLDRRCETADLVDERAAGDATLHYQLKRHLTEESRRLADFVFSCLADPPWLSHPRRARLNKLDVLRRAARLGFDTPPTLVTGERSALRQFGDAHGAVITKPIGDVDLFVDGELSHFLFTTGLDAAAIDALPERFAPSLFQAQIDKEYELRVFYLAGECHAMAIFSQADPRTRTDFRRYNRERPNRRVPYRLAEATAGRIGRLMEELGLETGSVDLLATPGGGEVFLEVNPVGQFGMVSKPCNYGLEKKVAELLIAKATAGRHG